MANLKLSMITDPQRPNATWAFFKRCWVQAFGFCIAPSGQGSLWKSAKLHEPQIAEALEVITALVNLGTVLPTPWPVMNLNIPVYWVKGSSISTMIWRIDCGPTANRSRALRSPSSKVRSSQQSQLQTMLAGREFCKNCLVAAPAGDQTLIRNWHVSQLHVKIQICDMVISQDTSPTEILEQHCPKSLAKLKVGPTFKYP